MEYFNLINSRNKVVNGIIIICAVILSYNIYQKQAKNIVVLKQSKDLELKKNDTLQEIIILESKAASYKNFINNKDMASLIYKLNNIANDSGVIIKSIKPLILKDNVVYVRYPFSLSVSARTYADVGNFISALESSPDVYFIEALNINPSFKGDDPLPENMVVTIGLSTVLLK